MSQGNQSCLRFSLEESVWFQKGQEVAELLSVSLDPDISIKESDQYVTISGALHLTGEYKRYEETGSAAENDLNVPKYVQLVDEREDGLCDFSHKFPVDITIPNNRIHSLNEVNVNVESFDYVFPERSCLKLTAELTISGLYGDQQHEPAEEINEWEAAFRHTAVKEQEQEQLNQEKNILDVAEPFFAEARKQAEEDAPIQQEIASIPTFSFEVPERSPFPWETIPELSYNAIHDRAEMTTQSEDNAQEIEESPQNNAMPSTEEIPVKQATSLEESSSEESSSSPQEPKKKKPSKKKGMSITEFLARKEENDVRAKLKVCIVQRGDTLDTISEKYDVTVPNLLRINHLELNQEIIEGQVLYIPATYAKN